MTPDTALLALIDQLLSVGLVENPAVADDGAGGVVDRGFSVSEGRGRRREEAGRGKASRSGMRWREEFTVVLTHILAPAAGQRARVQAYRDMGMAYKAAIRPGTTLTTTGSVHLGDVSRKLLNSGTVLEQRFSVSVSFNFDLRLE